MNKISTISFSLLFSLLFFCNCNGQKKDQANDAPYAPYGGVFTPKGTLRVLIVFVSYKDKNSANPQFYNKNNNLTDWDYSKNNRLPAFVDPVTGDCPQYIFNKESDFDTQMDKVENNFSKEFALMSNNQFKMIGEVFKDASGKPTVVEIDPTGGYSWTQMNGLAVEEMQRLNPKMDLSRFDQRENHPRFGFDNSDTTTHKPDKILDFVVFVHRYSKNWGQEPKPGMRAWVGAGGGFASTGVMPRTTINGYRIAEGFTMTYRSGVFIHEVAHVLFNAPHIMGVNNVIGDFLNLQSAGWGVMAPSSIFSGFNSWERWYVGFSELGADIQSEADLKDGDSFVLKDYFTTGDAIRIKIPYSGGQNLWLENHAKLHPLDEHPWKGNVLGAGDTICGSASGVYAYVEAIESSRNVIFPALSKRANGIKVLHAGGNYDYHLYEDKAVLKNRWGNKMKSFKRLKENPISGMNNFFRYQYDSNNDGQVLIDPNYNSSKTEATEPIFREEVAPDSFVNTYGCFGVYDAKKCKGYVKPVAFQEGSYLDMSSNPLPLNYPRYNRKTKKLEPYVLNGLALKFSKAENGTDMIVKIRFKHTSLCNDRRWTGDIVLPNISEDEKADLELGNCIQLVLNRSKTLNTHEKTAKGDFVNPTVLTVRSGATLELKEQSKIVIEDDSKLVFEKGAKLILGKRAQIIVKSGAALEIEDNSIKRHSTAKIIREKK